MAFCLKLFDIQNYDSIETVSCNGSSVHRMM